MKHLSRVLWLSITLALWTMPVLAQSACKYITPDAVLTNAQWNWCFQQKNDGLGFTPLNSAGGVMTGKLITAPSSTSLAGFNVPPGIAALAPKDGDIWTTTSGLYAQINGATIGPIGAGIPVNASANLVFAGPSSGGAAAPAFRAVVSADLPAATSSAVGAVKPDNSTISVSSGTISAATATSSNLGIVKPDNSTITIAAGIISATNASIQSGVTGFTSATNGNCAYNNSGVLGNKACITRVNIQVFQTAGAITYTPTAGLVYADMTCVGGGGGGGGATAAVSNTAGGGGGGAGASSRVIVTAATIGASQSGSVGAGGTASTGAGGAGGDTNLGTLCVAKGGSGAAGSTSGNNGAFGGVASAGTGTFKVDGAGGGVGIGGSGTTTIGGGGNGGSSIFGGGGAGLSLSGGGRVATGCGGAGGGATSVNGGAANVGGTGYQGCVVITEYLN